MTSRPASSRVLHWVNELSTRPVAAVAVSVAVLGMFVAIVVTGFSPSLQFAFSSFCAGVTLSMVFLIQHTQRRSEKATQLKLDELLRALPEADDRVVRLEASPDDELLEVEESIAQHHAAVRGHDAR